VVTSEQFASLFVANYVRAVVKSMSLRLTFAYIFAYVLKHHGHRVINYGHMVVGYVSLYSVKGIVWIYEVDKNP